MADEPIQVHIVRDTETLMTIVDRDLSNDDETIYEVPESLVRAVEIARQRADDAEYALLAHIDGDPLVGGFQASVLSWDWKEQPDIGALDAVLTALTGGTVTVQPADDGTENTTLVFATRRLDPATATRVMNASFTNFDRVFDFFPGQGDQ